jgi:hypothetical protein
MNIEADLVGGEARLVSLIGRADMTRDLDHERV